MGKSQYDVLTWPLSPAACAKAIAAAHGELRLKSLFLYSVFSLAIKFIMAHLACYYLALLPVCTGAGESQSLHHSYRLSSKHEASLLFSIFLIARETLPHRHIDT